MTAALLDPPDRDTSLTAAAAAVAGVGVAIDQLLAVDLTVPSDADILDLLRDVEVQARRLHAATVRVVGQIVDRGRQVLPLSASDAAQRVRLAAATGSAPTEHPNSSHPPPTTPPDNPCATPPTDHPPSPGPPRASRPDDAPMVDTATARAS